MAATDTTELIESQLGPDGTADFDTVVEHIASERGVKENTAASYVYTAEGVSHQWTPDGDHIVTDDPAAGGSVLAGLDPDGSAATHGPADLEQEAGRPTGDTFEYLEELEDVDHPLVPDRDEYYRRSLEGNKSDVQVLTYDLSERTPTGADNVLLTGLPGVGKNVLIEYIAAQANWPLVRIPVGGGIRYEDLVGHYTPTADGDLEWTDGILTAAARYGFMVVLDEVNMMTGDISSPLHQITEDEGSRELVIRQTGEVITPHPRFRVAATRNPKFAGSNGMNRAFLSRFSEHELDFLRADKEVKVLTQAVEGLSASDIRPTVEYANDLRGRYPQELDLIVTTRDLKRVGDYIAGGLFDQKQAVRKVILPRADPDTDRGPLADEIDMKF